MRICFVTEILVPSSNQQSPLQVQAEGYRRGSLHPADVAVIPVAMDGTGVLA